MHECLGAIYHGTFRSYRLHQKTSFSFAEINYFIRFQAAHPSPIADPLNQKKTTKKRIKNPV